MFLIAGAFLLLGAITTESAPTPPEERVEDVWTPEIPAALAGPYIVDPEILKDFDAAGEDCGADDQRLTFACLIYRDGRSAMKASEISSNPFKLDVFDEVTATVTKDLQWIRTQPQFGGAKVRSLSPDFLKFDGASIELVGVINRMDRQFNRDIVPEHNRRLACGEISAIYRFGYKGELRPGTPGERRYGSRLPVTMNVVFSAQPWAGAPTCREIAARWLAYAEEMRNGSPIEILREKAASAISSLRSADIDRIELNMQGSRVPASGDDASVDQGPGLPAGTDFGTLATYIIRVFRWDKVDRTSGHWHVSYLTNQIDRARLLGDPRGDANTCEDQRGKQISRRELADYLFTMGNSKKSSEATNAFGDVDNGILNIPQRFLACRAISVSPGGASRSANQPFWNTTNAAEAILTDEQINAGLKEYKRRYPASLSFIGTADEFRARLNEASCSGCHQSRAIAGFHFPGADVAGTSPVNAVYLPGSPHFFGDQPRRLEILRKIADGGNPQGRALATSYAVRPLNRFAALAPDPAVPPERRIQLVGGWGGACMTTRPRGSTRKWDCAAGLECQAVFGSSNQPNIGMCVNPSLRPQIGEAMQLGAVKTTRFGFDTYLRSTPAYGPSKPGQPRNTTIDTKWLPAPAHNSWFAAHQEFNVGLYNAQPGETDLERARRIRDQGTGGFPAGSLRLSECTDLPGEATCALLASSGFNACLDQVGDGKRTPESCFRAFTNYAGVRSCDPANPCRDDYICLSPMRYLAGDAKDKMAARLKFRKEEYDAHPEFRTALSQTTFGEAGPDDAWLSRNGGRGDRRGVCIPPYFVFQFKADGHVVPPH
ncbi:hypothetical protein [Sphingobium sp. Sx8-8]|uniref:hypothetical protein n=1 Tax=Sphingobium sp. Sx8-8 TaxID=2933617 RepID=UPI001F5A5DEF|nr:hypothetical protein [Sphingobium sp. Sx8-8]